MKVIKSYQYANSRQKKRVPAMALTIITMDKPSFGGYIKGVTNG